MPCQPCSRQIPLPVYRQDQGHGCAESGGGKDASGHPEDHPGEVYQESPQENQILQGDPGKKELLLATACLSFPEIRACLPSTTKREAQEASNPESYYPAALLQKAHEETP